MDQFETGVWSGYWVSKILILVLDLRYWPEGWPSHFVSNGASQDPDAFSDEPDDQYATAKRFHYDDHDQLRRHLDDFIAAYNYGRRLKTLKDLTPYEFVCKEWTSEPKRFWIDPIRRD